MKKTIKICIIEAVIIFLILGAIKLSDKNVYPSGDAVFELCHNEHDKRLYNRVINSDDSYFALRDDNILTWTYGWGVLHYGAFGNYFTNVKERGEVYITDDEAKALKKHMKDIIKNYDPVKAEFSVNFNDSDECIIKTNGRFYNRTSEMKNKKIKFSDEYYNMESLEKEMMDIIEKYHEKYEDRMDEIYHENIGHKLYSYICAAAGKTCGDKLKK